MLELYNGEYREMSPEKEAELKKLASAIPSDRPQDDTDRITKLETRASELETAIIGGI